MPSEPDGRPEYPRLCEAADAAASQRKSEYLRLTRIQLLMLVAVAALSSIGVAEPNWASTAQHLAVLIATALALLAGGALRLQRLESKWFQCRAMCESVRNLVWLYAMDRPLPGPAKEPDTQLYDAIRHLKERLPFAHQCVAEFEGHGTELQTEWMRRLRARPVAERLGAFYAHRIEDQVRWYRDRVTENARAERAWSLRVLALEVVAVVLASLQAVAAATGTDMLMRVGPLALRPDPLNLIVTGAAAMLAYLQVKRHGELTNTYRVAADDLAELAHQARQLASRLPGLAEVEAEGSLTRLIEHVETAISREHSVWMGRSPS